MKQFVFIVLFLMIFVATMTGNLNTGEILLLGFWYLLIVGLEYGMGGDPA